MTEAQRRALVVLAELSGTAQRTVVASQVAHRLYGSAYRSAHGRGPGGRPATAGRLLDALVAQGLAAADWSSPIHQRQWYVTMRGLEAVSPAAD